MHGLPDRMADGYLEKSITQTNRDPNDVALPEGGGGACFGLQQRQQMRYSLDLQTRRGFMKG